MADRVPKSVKGTARWRAGQAPGWAKVDEPKGIFKEEDGDEAAKKAPAPEAIKHDATDRRLRRLAEGRRVGEEEEDAGPRGGRRHVAEAEIMEGGSDADNEDVKQEPASDAGASSDEEDEDAVETRRERMRATARARAAEGEEVVEVAELPLEEEDEGAAGSESSWEYESESEGEDERKLVKPVFVTKVGRATMEERARIDAEYEAEETSKKKRAEGRKLETRQMVAEELVREQQQVVARTQRATREDTDSEGNEEEEYDRWRLRELKRVKRDKEERQVHEREKLEVERRRGMTDSQVVAEDQQLGKGKKTRAQMVFMQKYHHKGAFFMENDEANQAKESLYNRDTNEALESDRNTARQAQGGPYEGSKVFEVRRGQFGKMGQTKWTHLTNEDTTKLDSPWMQDDQIRRKFIGKSGGMAK